MPSSGRAAGARDHRLPVLEPGRAGDRSAGVAQLEVHARAGRAQVHELAHELHACERAQLRAQRAGVLADGKRARPARCPGMPALSDGGRERAEVDTGSSIGASIDGDAPQRTPAGRLRPWPIATGAGAGARASAARARPVPPAAASPEASSLAAPAAPQPPPSASKPPCRRRARARSRRAGAASRERAHRSSRGRRAPARALASAAAVGAADPRRRDRHRGRPVAGEKPALALLIAGLVAVLIGTVEVTLREHLSGYRSQTLILTLLPTILLFTGVVLLADDRRRR